MASKLKRQLSCLLRNRGRGKAAGLRALAADHICCRRSKCPSALLNAVHEAQVEGDLYGSSMVLTTTTWCGMAILRMLLSRRRAERNIGDRAA